MLTDRQNTFLDRIMDLIGSNASSNGEEQYYLYQARQLIFQKWDFKPVINSMNLSLKELSKNNPLSPEVKKLYDDLVAVYGEPDENLKLNKSHAPKDWRDSDPDWVYTGYGRVSGWRRRDGGKSVSIWKVIASYIFFSMNAITFIFTPFPRWLRSQLGTVGFWIVIVIYSVSLMTWIIKSGNPKKRH